MNISKKTVVETENLSKICEEQNKPATASATVTKTETKLETSNETSNKIENDPVKVSVENKKVTETVEAEKPETKEVKKDKKDLTENDLIGFDKKTSCEAEKKDAEAPAKKTRKKRETKKKTEPSTSLKVDFQFHGMSFNEEDIKHAVYEKIKDLYPHRSNMKEIYIYVKAEDEMAYYVIDDEIMGKLNIPELFMVTGK